MNNNNNYNRWNNNGGGNRYQQAPPPPPRQPYQQQQNPNDEQGDKKPQHRRTVDYFGPMGKRMIASNVYNRRRARQPMGHIRPEMSYFTYLLPPSKEQPTVVDVATKFVHVSTNKAKHAIHAIKWTPDAKRVLVSSYSGEFTVWNGLTFNFESIMQAHDSPIFAVEYSHDGDWLISGDQEGTIKYWEPNFNNVNILPKCHDNAIQDLSFSPNDSKFISCSDDQMLKIWNFSTAQEERVLKGHHWDVKCCDWHSSLGLVVSGSKDNLVKLWDPRDATCITTMHDFKHTVAKVRFQKIGNERLLAACSRDHSTRVFDIRTMKPLVAIRMNNDTDLSGIAWHPIHSSILTIGGYDGSMSTYDLKRAIEPEIVMASGPDAVQSQSPFATGNLKDTHVQNITESLHTIPYAHDKAIYTMEYHPLGHLLCTAGADKSLRFWCRARPNDPHGFKDTAYTGESWAEKQQHFGGGGDYRYGSPEEEPQEEVRVPQPQPVLPGFSIPGLS
ncbi:DEKNAAC103676 [Brettanomyces naardenensis]|uniref:Polyadenylation factor subunit 2 n=1 Tax=Brettanomyces naardenensis TaxID=13370 RepID=A0A448YNU4_BRENA|nr:DEKNAAC103676 [Brettanomyces naardenensis]